MSAKEELDPLAAEYVLGTQDAVTRRTLQARISTDAAFAQAVSEWESRLLPLASMAEAQTPSRTLWPRIAASTGPAPAASGWWHSLVFWRGLSAAGLAAAAIMAAVLVLRPVPPGSPQFLVVLVAPQSQAPGWLVQADSSNMVELVPLTAVDVPADRTLQFWTKADSWKAPVSLGLVQSGKTLKVPLDKLPPLEAGQLFELTLEPAGGSPVGKPTGPIQFIGRTVRMM